MSEGPLPPLRIGSHEAPVIPDVLQEHLEEVAFLSIQRRKLLFSPEIPLKEFLPHEARIRAHWEGLLLGGGASVRIAIDRMEEFDPWEVYAAVRVWLELGRPTAEEVTQRLEDARDEHLPAWREALRRMGAECLGQILPPGNGIMVSPRVQSVLAYAWGWQGILPVGLATRLAFDSDPAVRRSVARAIGWGAAREQAQELLAALWTDPDTYVRRGALWSLALLAPDSARAAARRQLASEEPDPFAARVLGFLGGPAEGELLTQLVGHGAVGPAVVRALGDLGDPPAVDLLIELLDEENEELVEAAQDALGTITGSILSEVGEQEDDAVGDQGGENVSDEVRAQWVELAPQYRQADHWLRGHPFPWQGSPEEEPMEAIWRSGLTVSRSDAPWLRHEVPDGFFDGAPSIEAVPGE